jgi:hypothetical protein
MPHHDPYAEWKKRLEAEGIFVHGVVDRKRLEKAYPEALTEEQIEWIEGKYDDQEELVESPFHVGDVLHIAHDDHDESEKVTVVSIEEDGIHLSSTEDETVEYVADPEELESMIVK